MNVMLETIAIAMQFVPTPLVVMNVNVEMGFLVMVLSVMIKSRVVNYSSLLSSLTDN